MNDADTIGGVAVMAGFAVNVGRAVGLTLAVGAGVASASHHHTGCMPVGHVIGGVGVLVAPAVGEGDGVGTADGYGEVLQFGSGRFKQMQLLKQLLPSSSASLCQQ
jgi:hypothetical protein